MIAFDDLYHLQLVLIWSLCFLSINMALLRFYPIPKSVFHALDQKNENVIFAEFISYFSSCINALVCFFFGLSIILDNGVTLWKDNKPNESYLVAFTLGYFLSDTLTGMVYHYNNTLMNLHHVLVLFGGFYVLWIGAYANLLVLAMVIAELSNIFRTIEMIADKYPDQKRIAFGFGLCFAFSFVFCR